MADSFKAKLLKLNSMKDGQEIWITDHAEELMPMWCPPTPPQGINDVYIDPCLDYLYESNAMTESQLPPVYVKRESKRSRLEAGFSPDGRRPLKVHRKDESVYAPRSLFERPSPALARMRRDLKFQKYRGIVRPSVQVPGLKPVPRPYLEPENVPEWTVAEEMALLQAIKLQGLPLNLIILSPAHTPNWDLAADIVNNVSRIYRSPRQCKNRYESIILPREEGKIMFDNSQKKQKKTKNLCKVPTQQKNTRSMRTAQLYELDNNLSFTQNILAKYDSIKFIWNKKTATPKRRYDDPTKNPKQGSALADYKINYDAPPTPMEIATRRSERIAKEKQKTATPANATAPSASGDALALRVCAAGPTAPASPPVKTAPTPSRAPAVPRNVTAEQLARIVVASQQTPTVVAKGLSPATVTASSGAAVAPLSQLQQQYKQQALQQQLKILQQQSSASTTTTASQQRTQMTQQVSSVGKPSAAIMRTLPETDVGALLKRQQQALVAAQQAAGKAGAAQAQLFTASAHPTHQLQVATVTVSSSAGGVGVKPSMKMATPQQLRQLQLQQLALAQRKGANKLTQLAQVSGAAQVIVAGAAGAQVHKALPPGVTVQQLQQAMRHMPQARVLPRQAIQVVSSNAGGARVTNSVTHHQVILSQVSAALQARAQPPAPAPAPPPDPLLQLPNQSDPPNG